MNFYDMERWVWRITLQENGDSKEQCPIFLDSKERQITVIGRKVCSIKRGEKEKKRCVWCMAVGECGRAFFFIFYRNDRWHDRRCVRGLAQTIFLSTYLKASAGDEERENEGFGDEYGGPLRPNLLLVCNGLHWAVHLLGLWAEPEIFSRLIANGQS